MGVDRTDYIIYGWKLPFEIKDNNGIKIDIYDDKYLPFIEGHPGVKYTIISDGMCGKYNMFGIMLEKADGDDGWASIELSFDDLSKYRDEAISKFKELFYDDENIGEPKVIIFSDFS
jgi:hypothetical protein